MKNVTLSLPDDLLRKSRAYAEKHGSTLNELIRTLLKQTVSPSDHDPIQKLIDHTKHIGVDTSDWKWDRNDLYDREIFS